MGDPGTSHCVIVFFVEYMFVERDVNTYVLVVGFADQISVGYEYDDDTQMNKNL